MPESNSNVVYQTAQSELFQGNPNPHCQPVSPAWQFCGVVDGGCSHTCTLPPFLILFGAWSLEGSRATHKTCAEGSVVKTE